MKPLFARIKNTLHSYVTLTRGERRGVAVLLVLIVITMAVPYIYDALLPPRPGAFDALVHKLQAAVDSGKISTASHTDYTSVAFKTFDPNTVTEAELTAMGLLDNIATHWVHYRDKGMVFKRKEDVLKIYGMDTGWYKKAGPYIIIVDDNMHSKMSAVIELNTADTIQLMRLYGIGHKRSEAIVNYRTRLGGFYAKTQLYEIHALPDSVLTPIWNNITVNTHAITKFNINSVTEDKMRTHPYIGKKMAVILTAYRARQPINNLSELLQVPGMDTTRLHKLQPYLVF